MFFIILSSIINSFSKQKNKQRKKYFAVINLLISLTVKQSDSSGREWFWLLVENLKKYYFQPNLQRDNWRTTRESREFKDGAKLSLHCLLRSYRYSHSKVIMKFSDWTIVTIRGEIGWDRVVGWKQISQFWCDLRTVQSSSR